MDNFNSLVSTKRKLLCLLLLTLGITSALLASDALGSKPSSYANIQAYAMNPDSWVPQDFKLDFKRDFYQHELALDLSWKNSLLLTEAFILERKTGTEDFQPIAIIGADGKKYDTIEQSRRSESWFGIIDNDDPYWEITPGSALKYLSYRDEKLAPQTYYAYRLKAISGINSSSYTKVLSWELTSTDWTPKQINVFTKSPSSTFVTWDSVPAGKQYELSCKTASGAYSILSIGEGNGYNHLNLVAGVKYSYRVRAMYGSLYSGYSAENTWQLTPESWRPTELSATAIGTNSICIKWKDYCPFSEGVEIERQLDSGSFEVIGKTAKKEEQFIDNQIEYGLLYIYRIRAFAENSYSAYCHEQQIWMILTPPTQLSTVTVSPSSVSLVWQDNSLFEQGFIIERSVGSKAFKKVGRVAANVTCYQVNNLSHKKQYTFRVKAYTGKLNSVYSDADKWSYSPPVFVLIPAGTFNNGQSEIFVSAIYMDSCELSQASYQAVMGNNPAQYTKEDNLPVESVTWFDAIEYCNRRSAKEHLKPCYSYASSGIKPDKWPSGWNKDNANQMLITCNWKANGYRLPTEAEWQFAAQEAVHTLVPGFNGENKNVFYAGAIVPFSWNALNSGGYTHPIGAGKANKLGLHDLLGNVWEWVWDIYGDYPDLAAKNPTGAEAGEKRVIRGGSMSASPDKCQANFRDFMLPTSTKRNIGFRVCRTKKPA